MRILYRVFLIILTTGCLTDRTALAQWSSATLSQARANITTTNVGTKAFFAGGYLLTTYTSSDQVDIYDDSTGQWTTTKLSQPRFRLSAASLGKKAFFAGGVALGNITDRVDIYDDSTRQWTTAQLSRPRWSITAAGTRGKILFAGGVIE